MPSIFDSLGTGQSATPRKGGSIFDQMGGEDTGLLAPDAPVSPLDVGFLAPLKRLPGVAAEGVRAWAGGGGAATLAAKQIEDIHSARAGNQEAAERVAARGMAAGAALGALVPAAAPGMSALAAGGIGAGTNVALNAAQNLAMGESPSENIGLSAGLGFLLPAGVQAVVNRSLVKQLEKPVQEVAHDMADDIAGAIAPTRPSRLTGMTTYADELRGEGPRGLAPEFGMVGEAGQSGFVPPKDVPTADFIETPRTSTSLGRLHGEANKLGLDRGARLARAGEIVGRKIGSFKELSEDEANRVGAGFRSGRLRAAPEVPPIVLAEQQARIAERLAERPNAIQAGLKDAFKAYHRSVTAGASYLERMGPSGSFLAKGMGKALRAAQKRAGADLVRVRSLTANLTKAEREEVGRVMNGYGGSEKAQQIAAQLREVADTYASDAAELGVREMTSAGEKVAFRRMENWFPQIIRPDIKRKLLTEGSAEQEELIRRIVGGFEKDRAAAKAMIRQFVEMPSEIRTGSLQHSRSLLIPDEWRVWDVTEALPKYLMESSRRLEQARIFGSQDERAIDAIARLRVEGKDASAAARLYAAFADPKQREFSGLARLTNSFHVVSMLSTAGIIQPAQLANTISRVGYLNTLKGVTSLFSKHGREWAGSTGATLTDLIHDIAPRDGGISSKWTTIIGLQPLDRANRLASALAGKYHAMEIAKKYAANPKIGRWANQLERMGINPNDVLRQGGNLTDDQLREAALGIANDTQFAGTVLDLPMLRNTPQGQFIYLFKSFALQQGRFVKDLVKKAARGEPGELIRYATALGTVGAGFGEVTAQVKSILSGRERPDEAEQRYLEALTYAGSLGIMTDMIRAMDRGPDAVAAFIGGPAFGEFTRTMSEIPDAVRGEPDKLMRHAISRVPIAGQALAKWLVP